VRHARKLGLWPGKTAIIQQLAAPGLDFWKKKQAVLAALTLSRAAGESEDAWLARVYEDADATAAKAAEEGTKRHAAIQTWYSSKILNNEHALLVNAVRSRLDSFLGEQQWYSEVVVRHPIGCCTKIDLCSDQWVLDIKSKDGDQAKLDNEK